MKWILRTEEAAQFLLSIVALAVLDVPWWTYLILAAGPDIGMVGYLANARAGAVTYNILHHKGIAVLFMLVGVFQEGTMYPPFNMPTMGSEWITSGIILFGHSSMDRMLGFGLKHGDAFTHTHLGWIGGPDRS